MSTALAIQKTIIPPPTKTEVIEALVQLRFQEWQKKDEKDRAELKKLQEKLERHAFKLVKQQPFEKADITIERWTTGQIKVCFDISPEMMEEFSRYKAITKALTSFDEKEERRIVHCSLNGTKGKRDLLADEGTRKKLVALGTQIGIL